MQFPINEFEQHIDEIILQRRALLEELSRV